MTKELLKRSNANVISIDWSGGSDPPYTQAVANIRLVGVMTAHLINMISEQGVGLQTEKIHIIGHSLGAHLASYVGTTLRRTFNQRLGRITGSFVFHFSSTFRARSRALISLNYFFFITGTNRVLELYF